jgi:hypothetical protein
MICGIVVASKQAPLSAPAAAPPGSDRLGARHSAELKVHFAALAL